MEITLGNTTLVLDNHAWQWINNKTNNEWSLTRNDKFYWYDTKEEVIPYDSEVRLTKTFHILWRKLCVDRIIKIRECY